MAKNPITLLAKGSKLREKLSNKLSKVNTTLLGISEILSDLVYMFLKN